MFNIETAERTLSEIRSTIRKADEFFDKIHFYGQRDQYDEANFEWYTEIAFLEIIVLSEALNLDHLRQELTDLRNNARTEGFGRSEMGPDEPYSVWLSELRKYVKAFEALLGTKKTHTITKEVDAILRECNYSINNPDLFSAPPTDEADVHKRIEGILKCVYPDLLTKPRLPKPIKSFEPDTGLPSVQTLIEYKFLSRKDAVSQIADEVLADTRGYESREWDKFVYVIYETKRFKAESEWNHLLRKCNVPRNTSIIVLSGEAPQDKKARKKIKYKGRRS